MGPYTAICGGVLHVENSKVWKVLGSGEKYELATLPSHLSPASCISINADGTLLAIASKRRVGVWLVTPETNSLRELTRDGEEKLSFSSDIISIKWHPCARANAGLVILTSSQLLSVFLPPGQPISIETTDLKDSSNLALEPAGFGFGSEESPLGRLSLYLGTVDGDIYRLFPYVPPEVELSSASISHIRQFVDLGDWNMELESWSDTKNERVTILKRNAETATQTMRDSEPLRLSPYQKDLYTETTLDLSAGDISWNTDIIVQSTERFVIFYALASPLSDTLVTVALVRFASAQKQRQIRHIGARQVFVETSDATHVLDISGWTSDLFDAVVNGRGRSREKLVTKVTAYPRLQVYRTSDNIQAIGTTATWPLSADSSVDAIRSAGASSDSSTLANTTSASIGEETNPEPEFLDPGVFREINAALADAAPSPAPFIPDWGANLGSLRMLNTVGRDFNKKIVLVGKQLAEVQLERQAQEREALQQKTDLDRLKHRTEGTSERLPQLKVKLNGALERQNSLSERLRKVTDLLAALEKKKPSHMPSKAEEDWYAELKQVLPKKIDALEAQVKQISGHVSAVQQENATSGASASKSAGPLTAGQTLELHWRLQNQENVVKSLMSRLNLK